MSAVKWAVAVRRSNRRMGWTIVQLARESGFTEGRVRTWLHHNRCTAQGAVKIAEVLGWKERTADAIDRAYRLNGEWVRAEAGVPEAAENLQHAVNALWRHTARRANKAFVQGHADWCRLVGSTRRRDLYVAVFFNRPSSYLSNDDSRRFRNHLARGIAQGGQALFLRVSESALGRFNEEWKTSFSYQAPDLLQDDADFRRRLASSLVECAGISSSRKANQVVREHVHHLSCPTVVWHPNITCGFLRSYNAKSDKFKTVPYFNIPGGYGGTLFCFQTDALFGQIVKVARAAVETRLASNDKGEPTDREKASL